MRCYKERKKVIQKGRKTEDMKKGYSGTVIAGKMLIGKGRD